MAPKLATSWAVRFAAGEPLAQVEVQNLQTTTQAASDAWGRPGKTQPLLLSATISFAQPFVTAAAEDRLTTETLHYGNLSKAMLAAAASHHQHSSSSPSSSPHTDDDESSHLGGLVQHIWAYLTGRSPSGAPYQLDDETARTTTTQTQPLLSQALSTSTISYLAATATLPKASLLGSAVSLTISAAFQAGTYATTLRLHEVRVPTLIGVNDNERLAKQVVVATVTLDRIDEDTLSRLGDGLFLGTEKLVVRTLDSSSFETLEALGVHMADLVLHAHGAETLQVHVRMEKPTAVALADCPVVEVCLLEGPRDAGGPYIYQHVLYYGNSSNHLAQAFRVFMGG